MPAISFGFVRSSNLPVPSDDTGWGLWIAYVGKYCTRFIFFQLMVLDQCPLFSSFPPSTQTDPHSHLQYWHRPRSTLLLKPVLHNPNRPRKKEVCTYRTKYGPLLPPTHYTGLSNSSAVSILSIMRIVNNHEGVTQNFSIDSAKKVSKCYWRRVGRRQKEQSEITPSIR